MVFEVREGEEIDRRKFFKKLIDSQYKRNDIELKPGRFRVHGDLIDIMPSDMTDSFVRLDMFGDEVERILVVDYLTQKTIDRYKVYNLFPAYDHAVTRATIDEACDKIIEELN